MPALESIRTNIALDVYDHDLTPSAIKAIACDDNTRYVAAELTNRGFPYYLEEDAGVELTVLKPDKTGTSVTGTTYSYTITIQEEGEEPVEQTVYGPYAELDRAALAKSGMLYAQFKITVGDQILRTEIFMINNGRALDAEISDWSGDYQGYNLDELVENFNDAVDEMSRLPDYIEVKVAAAVASRISVQDGTLIINNSEPDVSEVVSELESYVDRKIAQMQTYVDQAVDDKLDVQNNGIYITTQ